MTVDVHQATPGCGAVRMGLAEGVPEVLASAETFMNSPFLPLPDLCRTVFVTLPIAGTGQ